MTRAMLDKELHELETQMLRLGTLVENALAEALEALEAGNEEKASAVIVGDTPIDDLHTLIEEHAFRVLILQQPLGGRDLRYLTSLLPLTIDLERIGDDAEGIAQYTIRWLSFRHSAEQTTQDESIPASGKESDQSPEAAVLKNVLDLGQLVRGTLSDTMKAFTTRDAQAARNLWAQDVLTDRRAARVRRDLMELLEGNQAVTALQHDPHIVQRATYLLWIVYKLERIADHCTNICERITFITEGDTEMYPVSA
jgi:phosphate transport system protein